jgi:natural product biosynthesis luciferase-like monooxygenase protein
MKNRLAGSSREGRFPIPAARTLVDVLKRRSIEQPGALAYTFLSDDDVAATLTFGELDLRARAIGSMLTAVGAVDERVLLLYPTGLDFICAFLGSLYARASAVPVPPPRFNRNAGQIARIAADCEARFVLTTQAILSRANKALKVEPGLGALRWLTTDESDLEQGDDWLEPEIGAETFAFLQYTSGSTSVPRGVKVTHGNLMHNERFIQQAFNQDEESIILSWLPQYHDMGLIGGLIQPLYLGARCILMSPFSFLQRPQRWLRAISDYRVTTSGGPNFAYDLCARKVQGEPGLDLSSWAVAFNGSEPIRSETLERFAAAFEPFGFRREAFSPCYGLAEATLLVSGGTTSGPSLRRLERKALKSNRVVTASDGDEARLLVPCGRIGADQRVIIVAPDLLTICPENQIGEIWVSGPSVAGGYYNRSEETRQTFGAYPAGSGEGPFLRTGDLGFISDNELIVTGRLKDLVIVRGQNYYPQDIEAAAQAASSMLKPAAGAAFSIEAGGSERLVIVQEVEHRRALPLDEIIELVRQSVGEEFELRPSAIVLIRAGSIPRTTSGKVRRHACRAAFLEGCLDVVADWSESTTIEAQREGSDYAVPDPKDSVDAHSGSEEWIASWLAAKLDVPRATIDFQSSLTRYGLDSILAIDLANDLERRFGVRFSLANVFQAATITDLAALVDRHLGQCVIEEPIAARSRSGDAEFPLSRGQQALYFMHQLALEAAIYNVAAAATIHGPVDARALRAAFGRLVARHPALRTNFVPASNGGLQRVSEEGQAHFAEVDAESWIEERLRDEIENEANHWFDLENEPLLRVTLYRRAEKPLLLIVVHHIVVDFRSLAILLKDLGSLYSAEMRGASISLPEPALDFSHFVRWQDEMLASPEGDRSWEYWRATLAGELPTLDLCLDRPRPTFQTYAGSMKSFMLPDDLACEILRFCRDRETTLFTTMAAAFEAFLHRYTGQDDILLGALTSGRSRAGFADLVGYFVNPIVLRADFAGDPGFDAFLTTFRQITIDALDHQDYPFPLLVERLQPVRDSSRPPLFQALLIYQQLRLSEQESLPYFAAGVEGASLQLGELKLGSFPLYHRPTQFDLTLKIGAADSSIVGSLEYNTDLFEESTIARMADHFLNLVGAMIRDPEGAIGLAPIMRRAELDEILLAWNQTSIGAPEDTCVHERIEQQVRRTPDSIAVSFKESQVTYSELNRKANQIARRLIDLGVGPETRVAICVERSVEMVEGLLGILKAGGGYVPMDPAFPRERLLLMVEDSRAAAVVTQMSLIGTFHGANKNIICVDADVTDSRHGPDDDLASPMCPANLAYTIFTSGSTGRPKGVMVTHANVVNFFRAMDRKIPAGPDKTWLAVTSISFDISVLELLWTLSRGFRVVIQGKGTPSRGLRGFEREAKRQIAFSLFYFASDDQESAEDGYRLLMEGARFADRHGFSAVWTPERHFHAFGGLYPNPSVTGAAIAAITENVAIRAGSVVLPLHQPIRVAEEWSVIDNLSRGRAGISVASGWHSDDFILAPENYASRKDVMLRDLEVVRKLWRGEAVAFAGGAGNTVQARIFPRPVQKELPVWITAAGSPETFEAAGQVGANVLTHLLGQELEEVAEKIRIYRDAWRQYRHGPGDGYVTLMVHSFIGEDMDEVRETVRGPFISYLRSSYGLIRNLARSLGVDPEAASFSEDDMDALLSRAFERYFQSSGLMGTPATCLEMVRRLKSIGVDEVACLIDFGIDVNTVLENLRHLDLVRREANKDQEASGDPLVFQIERHGITHMQCTPSMARLMIYESDSLTSLKGLQNLLIGGEALPLALAQQLGEYTGGDIHNMYGPTETTIWSSTDLVPRRAERITIGGPIANTQTYVLDKHVTPAPVNVAGLLHIGGDGVARGYLSSPDLTAAKFLPDPFSGVEGSRIYATGDVARYLESAKIEYLGRSDEQVKLRGHRIEPEEIETVLQKHPSVVQAAVMLREYSRDDPRLVAYVVCGSESLDLSQMKEFLSGRLPEYMIPSALVRMDSMPMTPNGKIHRKGLPAGVPDGSQADRPIELPRNAVEEVLACIWAELLGVPEVGIHDDFFELGGHSILSSQLISRVRELFRVELPLRSFFAAPTVSAVAAILLRDEDQRSKVERMAELLISVASSTEDEAEAMLNESQFVS